MKIILLPVDIFHDDGWQDALNHAVFLARQNDAAIHALAVIPDFGMALVGSYFPEGFSSNALSEAEKNLAGFVAKNLEGLDVTTHIKHGTVYKEILICADEIGADMIVMASHRPEMRDYLLGPNAARVVRHARQSVTVIR
ncbi:MAG: universal stress protein [Rhodobacteraceae bacterium]|nr:universal stress protein [Paracoccaceae bacterium]